MNTNKVGNVYFTAGFRSVLWNTLEYENASLVGIGKLLATQPVVIAYLFDRLIDVCGGAASSDDMSVNVIVETLGVNGVGRLLGPIVEIPLQQKQAWRDKTVDACARARMMAWIADPRRDYGEIWGVSRKAQVYFLYGLVADIVGDDDAYLQRGHEVGRFFPSLDGEKLEAFRRTTELVKVFKSGETPFNERALRRVWLDAVTKFDNIIS